jgi:predicted aspartyl protease
MRIASVLLLVSVSLCSPAQAAVTPFELGDQGGVIVQVSLNGRGPFRMLLDTGSTHSAVSEAVAAAIGAPAVAKTVLGSATGGREVIVVRVDALVCGALVVRGLLASVAAFDRLGDSDRIQGVIGLDALAAVRYTIDFRRRELLWWPERGSMARGMSFALEGSHGRFLISLPQRGNVLRLVPDSGAGTLLLFEPSSRLPLTLLGQRGTLTTVSAQGTVRLARMRELQIGTVRLENVAAAVVRRNPTEPEETDGLLPLHLFDKVTFDGPNGVLILEVAPARSVS